MYLQIVRQQCFLIIVWNIHKFSMSSCLALWVFDNDKKYENMIVFNSSHLMILESQLAVGGRGKCITNINLKHNCFSLVEREIWKRIQIQIEMQTQIQIQLYHQYKSQTQLYQSGNMYEHEYKYNCFININII